MKTDEIVQLIASQPRDEFPYLCTYCPIRGIAEKILVDLMDERQVATVLTVSQATLKKWRGNDCNEGPCFIRIGESIRYFRAELIRYLYDESLKSGMCGKSCEAYSKNRS